MTKQTADRIANEIDRILADVQAWLKELGVPDADAQELYDAVVRENGMMARLIASIGASFIPFANKPTGLEVSDNTIGKLRSGEFRAQLIEAPEPTPEELNQFQRQCRDIVPALAHYFTDVGNQGPQYRHGGRRTKLGDPKIKLAICNEIKRRRGPNVTLQTIFESIAKTHGVSASKIKQIWLDCPADDPINPDKIAE